MPGPMLLDCWPIDKLKPHPKQAELFGDLPDDELAENLDANGPRGPVAALPDGTLVSDHQRLCAVRQLGRDEIVVVVRRDLVGARPEAAEKVLVKDIVRRRQLSPLVRARCYFRLFEIEGQTKRPLGGSTGDVMAAVAHQLEQSQLKVKRHLLVMKAPPEVQAAFDRGEISLTDAGKVVHSPNRDRIEWRLGRGEPIRKVLAEELRSPREKARDAGMTNDQLTRALRHGLSALEWACDFAPAEVLRRHRPLLEQTSNLLAQLLDRGRGRSA